MSSYTFRTIIESEVGGGYHGFVPLLKGVHVYGSTLKGVQTNLKEAIKCHVEGLLKDKEVVPQEGETFEAVQTFYAKNFVLTPA